MSQQSLGDRQHLLLTTAQGAGLLVAALSEDGETAVSLFDGLEVPSSGTGQGIGAEDEVVLHPELAKDPLALLDERDSSGDSLVRTRAGDVVTLEQIDPSSA